jgi:DNA-binding MarR family transcriptional regulator
MSRTDIDDTEVAVMCDIARASGLDLDANKQKVVDRLIADGLVETSHGDAPAHVKLVVTPEGQRLLDDRGVGVNES